MKKVLVVTYYWPPAGGGGVQRIAKFCRYLGDWGWKPLVLTVANGNFPVVDESLTGEVAGIEHVYKAPSLEPHSLYRRLAKLLGTPGKGKGGPSTSRSSSPGSLHQFGELVRLNLFIPDSRIGWRRNALRKAEEIIARERPDAILSTAPPYTSHLIAMELKKRFDLPWVADFRDPWLENHAYNTVPRLRAVKALNLRLETKVLDRADRIVCANPGIAAFTSAKLPAEAAGKFTVITNGYDAADVRPSVRALPRFTVSYFGTVYPRRFPTALFEVIHDLATAKDGPGENLLFRVRGSVSPNVREMMEKMIPAGNLEIGEYIPHEEMLDLLYEAQVLVFVINDFKGNFATVPGKIFEYLPTGNPLLGLGPVEGDAAAILARTDAGTMFGPRDREGMKGFLQREYLRWKEGSLTSGPVEYEEFERRNLVGRLAEELNAVTEPVRR